MFNPQPKPTGKRKSKYIKPTSNYTTRQRKIEKAKRAKGIEYIKCCEGCSRNDVILSFSHRIPQRLDEGAHVLELPESGDYLCNECHEKVELFKFSEIPNQLLAAKIELFIAQNAPEYYLRKTCKSELNESI